MISRLAGRALPALRPLTSSAKLTITTSWTRGLAVKKPSKDTRIPGAAAAQSKSNTPTTAAKPNATSAAAAFGAPRSVPDESTAPQASTIQGDFNTQATPKDNTAPEPQEGKPADHSVPLASESANSTPSSNVLEQQVEFNTSADPTENVQSQSETQNNPDQPLPDLTQGIPSTLDFELGQARQRMDAIDENITEDPTKEPKIDTTWRPGRGELPDSAYVSSSEKKREQRANYMYGAVLGFALVGFAYMGRNWEDEEEEKSHYDAPSGWTPGATWARAKARVSGQLSYYQEPAFVKLLPDPDPSFERPYTLVLSLEDLLVHSEWSREHGWRMAKRPGVDYFLRYLSQYYELVIFTSAPFAMAEGVIKKLDPYHIVTWPLFREATKYKGGEYIKDLSYLNRDLKKVILIDTKEGHAQDQPENAIIIPKWVGKEGGKDLVALLPFLEYVATMATPDVRAAIKSFEGTHIPTEFAKREAIARKKFQQQLAEEQKKKPKSSLGGLISGALGTNKSMMVYAEGEQSPAEAFAQGKMLQDIARERGQKNYEALDKMIREEGEKWLKEEAAQEEAAKAESMKGLKSGMMGFFGGPADASPPPAVNAK